MCAVRWEGVVSLLVQASNFKDRLQSLTGLLFHCGSGVGNLMISLPVPVSLSKSAGDCGNQHVGEEAGTVSEGRVQAEAVAGDGAAYTRTELVCRRGTPGARAGKVCRSPVMRWEVG